MSAPDLTPARNRAAAVDASSPRISSGNVQADHVLGGGFPANSINILMGEPGTGKTLFAEQLLFANADGERPVLYLTTLSEPLSKVVTYLQLFPFYDERKLGATVLYEDIGGLLATQGASALVPRVREVIQTVGPSLIVIDSFKAIHDLSPSVTDMRHLISEFAGLLSAYAATTFLVGEYREPDASLYPEFAVADGIVEFARYKQSTRDERFLRVSKLRGSGYLEGLHGFRITPAGLEVYPRLVSPRVPSGYAIAPERVSSGVAGFDRLVGGGVWRGSTTVVAGPTGSGKTTIGLQFVLAGVAAGEPALYANFQENPTQLARAIGNLGGDVAALQDQGLHLLYCSSVELQIDHLFVQMFDLIERHGIRRVVIDAVGDLSLASADVHRTHDYLYALVQRFAVSGITALLLLEDVSHNPMSGGFPVAGEYLRLSYMCDNLVLLEIHRGERLTRRLSVYKTRGSAHDETVHPVTITAEGVRVG
jgi:circadian clock protein KaiC